LIAHACISQAIGALFRTDSLQVMGESLCTVHFVVGTLGEHHIIDSVLLEAVAGVTGARLPYHIFPVSEGVRPKSLCLV